jgi:cobyrinic acid a,c-diamide synthase
VVLNRVGGSRHEGKLRAAIERYTGLAVLGAIGEDPRLGVLERHLGLVPATEIEDAQAHIAAMRAAVCEQVDLEAILAIARTAEPVAPAAETTPRPPASGEPALRIGIARDRAFGFYYEDDLDAFRAAGASLVPIDTLHDAALPDVDGLFIGGGFPEANGAALAANVRFRDSLRRAVEAGLPVYAECGGLMYLARSLSWRGHTWEMVGAIPADVVMQGKPVGKGYVRLVETGEHPWGAGEGAVVHAHEFHYSLLQDVAPGLRYAGRVARGEGTGERRDGIVHRHVLAGYTHQRSVGGNDWVRRFVAYVREAKRVREGLAATLRAALH